MDCLALTYVVDSCAFYWSYHIKYLEDRATQPWPKALFRNRNSADIVNGELIKSTEQGCWDYAKVCSMCTSIARECQRARLQCSRRCSRASMRVRSAVARADKRARRGGFDHRNMRKGFNCCHIPALMPTGLAFTATNEYSEQGSHSVTNGSSLSKG